MGKEYIEEMMEARCTGIIYDRVSKVRISL